MTTPAKKATITHPVTLAAALLVFCMALICPPLFASGATLAHDMSVVVHPDSGKIIVEDDISVDRDVSSFEFVLNAGLSVRTQTGTLKSLKTSNDGLRTAYRVTLETPGRRLKLQYHGRPKFSGHRSLGDMPQGVVSGQAVYLDAASAWYPLFDQAFDRLSMDVTLPQGWQSVSIGKRSEHPDRANWSTNLPHDELYLIAGRFTRYARAHRGIDLSVWLLDDDPGLAAHYLDLMSGYIDHYSRLIGDYPYAKFAVVENPWQTGFGMPSFTLLGSRVLRLPFIPYTSLPHEILHNWWGNGVWVDYERGNWSEGLTAYLADHWMQERQGKGDQYRLKALQNYSNFAADGKDVPLLQFVSRHSDASQSIGYSKSLMLFHMLRRELGDAEFIAGLQRLWQRHRYTRTGFEQALQAIVGSDSELTARLGQWLQRPGAPRLQLGKVQVVAGDNGYRLLVPLSQAQDQGPPFVFDLPLAVTFEGDEWATRLIARIDRQHQLLEFKFPKRPLRVDIDPEYDLLRYLDPTEQPPALNRLFGGSSWLVLPAAAPQAMRDAWAALAAQWQARYPGLQTIDDRDAMELEPGANRIILGWDNTLIDGFAGRFARGDQALNPGGAAIADRDYAAVEHSVVLVDTDANGVTTGFIGANTPQAVQAMARKLTHYGSYGRLVFDGETGSNLLKDSLSSEHSSLSLQLGPDPVLLQLKPRPPLADDGG